MLAELTLNGICNGTWGYSSFFKWKLANEKETTTHIKIIQKNETKFIL